MNLYTLSRRATSTTHPSLLISLARQSAFCEAVEYSKTLAVADGLLCFLQLLQNRRVFQCGDILRDGFALGQHP